MKLNKIVINNFRNIVHAEYELDKINIFVGPNKQGKTNTIIAVYWAITGYLLDGSSDHASLKPLNDTRAEVSVELEFDTFKLKKVFYENWVKTRGTKEETMSGHITEIYINDIHVKNTDAIKTIASYFNVDNEFNTSKFDLLQAIVNPYYISKVDWKELRKFIIALIGDVSNEEVFNANEILNGIKDRLEVDNYDTSKTTKFYNSKIKECKDTFKEVEGKIKGLEDIHDVNDVDFNQAKEMIKSLDERIYSIKNNDDSGLKESKVKMNQELINLQSKYQELREADKTKLDLINKESNDLIIKYSEEIKPLKVDFDNLRRNIISEENKLSSTLSEINKLKLELGNDEAKKEQLYKKYDSISARVIEKGSVMTIDVITCPNCNHVLNQEAIDKANVQVEKAYQLALENKEKELADVITLGKATKLNIERLMLEIEQKEKLSQQLESNVKELKMQQSELNKKIENLETFINVERNNIKYHFESEQTKAILIDIDNKKKEIEMLDNSNSSSTLDKQLKISEIEKSKEQYQKIINDKNAYISAQDLIKKNQKILEEIGNNQMTLEQLLLLVNEFTLTKLQMFNDRVSEVFGNRVKFTLIENNIKEGSWNEVCYPSVLDKETPLTQGSGSEQILTGIYLIERIKKKLNMEDSLYIFDECDKLDTQSLAGIDTKSQLISTKVDDINYKAVTLEKRG